MPSGSALSGALQWIAHRYSGRDSNDIRDSAGGVVKMEISPTRAITEPHVSRTAYMLSDIYRQRQLYSERRIDRLGQNLRERIATLELTDLVIFAAGSYGRHEASKYSDIDLFFIYEGDGAGRRNRRTAELQLFGALINIGEKMKFPGFSNDCEFLRTTSCDDILTELGSQQDDALNHFTVRMLLLLESKPIHGHKSYTDVIQRVIAAYYRDYRDHSATFAPWFLLNDIGRYWKTILLNYENRRNPNRPNADKIAQKIKNFKLKFSRMTTCFATVAALGVKNAPVIEEDIFVLTQLTPRERLERVADASPKASKVVDRVLAEYAWFLGMTGLNERQLRKHFEDGNKRRELFKRANDYGGLMYELLATLDSRRAGRDSNFIRFLVI